MTPFARLFLALSLLWGAVAPAAPDPALAKASAELDVILEAHWKKAGVAPNAPASDEVFVRRAYLDFAGRIPTLAETRAFLASTSPAKRAELIDDLLRRESYVARFFNLWADILRYKSYYNNTSNIVPAAYGRYLRESLRTNKPYDQFAREMLSAKGRAWDNGAVGYYLRDPEMPLDNMALTTRVFLGTRIECAQCHNHPFDKWKQTEFYHLSAFTYPNQSLNEGFGGVRDAIAARQKAIDDDFKREKAASKDGGQAAAERKAARLAAFDYRGTVGVIKEAVGQLLSPVGLDRSRPRTLKLPHDFKEDDAKPFDVMAPATILGPKITVRPGEDSAEAFARWVASPENPRFTKVIVNRLWKSLFGLGLIENLDDLTDDTKPFIPEAEEYLEKLMVARKYDMKAVLAVIAGTRAYQASASTTEFNRGDKYHFTGPLLRRMTAEQAWDSFVALASHNPDARNTVREETEARRVAVSQMVVDAYEAFDAEKLVDLATARAASNRELLKRQTLLRTAMIEAKRAGDSAKFRELSAEEGRLERERHETSVREFVEPLLRNLAEKKNGPGAKPAVYENHKASLNPRVMAVEAWRMAYIPGYGPAPRPAAQLAQQAEAEKTALRGLALRLGVPEKDHADFVAYASRAAAEWVRAAELESPSPRGHFLRTLGQSDRDFVENANPNASIPQALLMLNGEALTDRWLLHRFSPVMLAVTRGATPEAQLENAYLSVLSRRPTAAEKAAWAKAAASGVSKPQDMIYTLLNTKQFIFVQ